MGDQERRALIGLDQRESWRGNVLGKAVGGEMGADQGAGERGFA